jgi:hypothetical protein
LGSSTLAPLGSSALTLPKTEFPNSLRAFDHLPLSLSLHYHDETFHIGRGDSRSRGCWRLLKWQLCKLHQGEALWGSRKTDDHRSLDEYRYSHNIE